MAKRATLAPAGDTRSGCPINLATEVIGDRWSLVVLRDMMFGNRRHFRELLTRSEEGIASNILAARLKHLQEVGLVTVAEDPTHKQRLIYSLTEPAIRLVPVLAMLGEWGRHHLPVTRELSIRAQLLYEGGAKMWEEFMEELRAMHLGSPSATARKPAGAGVLQRLNEAYEAERARNRKPAKRSQKS
jgi:DNA-binding HxlR family transcriptional regulator